MSADRIEGSPTLWTTIFDPSEVGYVAEEFILSGHALSYVPVGSWDDDGRWTVAPSATAPYRTRIVVYRPLDAAAFNGTVVVEWLNVSGGMDGPVIWLEAHRHLVHAGCAWVGITAQKVGVDGNGVVAGVNLKSVAPERYGTLEHPGDAFSFDMFTHVGQVLRRPSATNPLGPLTPHRLLASGTSQSAMFLTTYLNAIDPIATVFDGYLLHARPGGAATLETVPERALLPGDSDFLTADFSSLARAAAGSVRIRDDVRVPVITVVTETDVLGPTGFLGARQPDSDHFRLWEIAGAAHASTYLLCAAMVDSGLLPVEQFAALLAPVAEYMGMRCTLPINAGVHHHYVLQAALAHLDRWVQDGTPPPEAALLEVASTHPPAFELDDNGVARGGVRSPWVDVPTAVLSGLGQSGDSFAFLFGSTRTFGADVLATLYPGGRDAYLSRFHAATDAAVQAGFLLSEDAPEAEALAAAMYPPQ